MGKQLQVGWGQTKQKMTDNKEIKLYFISFVLAHSRHKYMRLQARPFTTRDEIRCRENAGKLLLTGEFQSYVKERKFKVHLCSQIVIPSH
jgi:transposase